jgi:tetratricopeptide (TPR) repeat protein
MTNNKWNTNMSYNTVALIPSQVTFVEKILADLKSRKRIAIVGHAGTGKTYLCRYLFKNSTENTKAVWIDRNVVIHEQEYDFIGIEDTKNTLIFFDGIDELPSRISNKYAKRLSSFKHAKIIITSRKTVKGFFNIEMPSITKEDMKFLLNDMNISRNIDVEHLTNVTDGNLLVGKLLVSLLKLNHEDIYTEIVNYSGKLNAAAISGQGTELIISLARSFFEKGDYNDSLQLYVYLCSLLLKSDNKKALLIAYNDIANVYQAMGAYDSALKYGEEALLMANKILLESDPLIATIYNNIGGIYSRMNNMVLAEEYYVKALELRQKYLEENNDDIANSLSNMGSIYFGTGNYDEALRYYNKAFKIRSKNKGGFSPDYATSLNNLGAIYSSMGNYTLAEKYYLEAKDTWGKVLGKDHPDYALSLCNMGTLYHNMGNYTLAEKYYLEAKETWGKVLGKEHPYYATSLNNLGILYSDMGDYALAEEYYLEAKDLREKVLGKVHPDYSMSLNNLGSLYFSMGDYAKVDEYFLEAKDICEKVLGKEHSSYITLLNNLGGLYNTMGDYARAEGYFLEAKETCEKVLGKEHPSYAALLNNLGELYNTMGDCARAEEYYLEAKETCEKVLGKEHPDYAALLNNLGELYRITDDNTKAEEYYLEAKDICEKVLGKEHPDYAALLNNFGMLCFSMSNYAKAEEYFLEAKIIWERVLNKENQNYTFLLDNMYSLYLAMGESSKALAYRNEEYQQTTKSVDQCFSFLSEQQREKYWNVHSVSFELTYSLSWFHPAPETSALSYNSTLFSKSLLLRSTNAVRDSVYSSDDQSLITQYENLSRLRQRIETLRQSGGGNEAYIQEIEKQADVIDKSLTQASAAYREFQADLSLSWQDIRNSLQEGEAAIEFVSFQLFDKEWTDKTIYAALVLRPNMDTPAWIPLCEETDLADFFKSPNGYDLLKQVQSLYDQNGPTLYAAIWQPLEKELDGVTTVYYSPSGLLHKLNFNAISITENSRLMDVYDLNLVSSTREVAYRNSKTASKPNSAVVYGWLQYDMEADSMKQEAIAYKLDARIQRNIALPKDIFRNNSQPDWKPLHFTYNESTSIQKILCENNITVSLYQGPKGNKESFKNLDGKRIAAIHLATHGFFFNDIEKNYEERKLLERLGGWKKAIENPLMRSGLLLAGSRKAWEGSLVEGVENGILFGVDVAHMNLLGAELVVLSACETALGVVNNSEGVFGLQRAFKLAGAETILMSMWEVDDQATSELMIDFYKNWLSGMSKQGAFKKTQQNMRKRYPSPYYWAAFVMLD